MTRRNARLPLPPVRPGLLLLAGALALGVGGCADRDPEPVPVPGDEADTAPTPSPAAAVAVHERVLVFLSTDADTAVVMPWLFRAEEHAEGVVREQGLWLARPAGWETLARDTVLTPETRTPWRILPTRRLRLAVGRDDAVEALRFGAVEMRPGELLADWALARGSVVRLHAGATAIPPEELSGLVVDHARSWAGEEATPGDWVFLHAGPDAQLFIEAREPSAQPPAETSFEGWSRVAFQERSWPEFRVLWEEVRAFEQARRDIPAAWRIETPGGEVEGRVRSVGAHLAAGTGPGPLLPVEAFFEVEGELRILGEAFAVRGLVRHLQP